MSCFAKIVLPTIWQHPRQIPRNQTRAPVVGEATTPSIGTGDRLIVGSGSGETEGALGAPRRARDAGAAVAALTSRAESTLGRLADHLGLIPGETTKLNI